MIKFNSHFFKHNWKNLDKNKKIYKFRNSKHRSRMYYLYMADFINRADHVLGIAGYK